MKKGCNGYITKTFHPKVPFTPQLEATVLRIQLVGEKQHKRHEKKSTALNYDRIQWAG